MKLQINRDVLINAVSLVVKAADKHHRIGPILGNIKLDLKGDVLTLVASDLEVELTTTVALPDGACIQAGATTLPAEKFFVICKALSADTVLLDANETQCFINGGSRFTLKTLPAKEFPSIGTPSITTTLKIEHDNLYQLINRTRFAMATQDVRHYLTGMLFEINDDKLTVVATDGHRLAVAHRALGEQYDERRVIIPGKAVGELERLLLEIEKSDKKDDVVMLGFDDEFLQVSLSFADDGAYAGMKVDMVARLIEGRFPDYRRVLPTNNNKSVVFDRDQVTEVLRHLSPLITKDAPGVLFDFKESDKVTVSVRNFREQDEAEEDLAVSYQGEPLEVSFNEAYLRAVLRVLEGDVRIEMTESIKPALIYQVGDEMNHQYVVMPMRV